jgi:hypothetical protein
VNRTSNGCEHGIAQTIIKAPTRRQVIAWGAAAVGLAMAPAVALTNVFAQSEAGAAKMNAHISQRDLDALSNASVLYIATVRKDGNQSTPAPVWFTLSPDNLVLIQTQPTTWKAKRIRRGSPVIVWIGKKHGPAFIGTARITSDPTVSRKIVEDYPKRYLMARLGLHRPTQEMFDKGQILPIAISPVHDLPEGFASQPGTPAPTVGSGHT